VADSFTEEIKDMTPFVELSDPMMCPDFIV